MKQAGLLFHWLKLVMSLSEILIRLSKWIARRAESLNRYVSGNLS